MVESKPTLKEKEPNLLSLCNHLEIQSLVLRIQRQLGNGIRRRRTGPGRETFIFKKY